MSLDRDFETTMPRACTEDPLVEAPAIGWFAQPGWQTGSALEETFGAGRPWLRVLTKLMSALLSLKKTTKPEGEK